MPRTASFLAWPRLRGAVNAISGAMATAARAPAVWAMKVRRSVMTTRGFLVIWAATARAHAETQRKGLTRRRGERGGSEARRLSGAAETARRIQGSCDVMACPGRGGARGVK